MSFQIRSCNYHSVASQEMRQPGAIGMARGQRSAQRHLWEDSRPGVVNRAPDILLDTRLCVPGSWRDKLPASRLTEPFEKDRARGLQPWDGCWLWLRPRAALPLVSWVLGGHVRVRGWHAIRWSAWDTREPFIKNHILGLPITLVYLRKKRRGKKKPIAIP